MQFLRKRTTLITTKRGKRLQLQTWKKTPARLQTGVCRSQCPLESGQSTALSLPESWQDVRLGISIVPAAGCARDAAEPGSSVQPQLNPVSALLQLGDLCLPRVTSCLSSVQDTGTSNGRRTTLRTVQLKNHGSSSEKMG